MTPPIPLDPAGAPRQARDLGRWMRWVEDQLKLRGSNRGIIERGSVGGGVVTIREILTSPTTVAGWCNTDTAVVSASGPLTMYLSHVPSPPGSLGVFWRGLFIPTQNWALAGNVLTIEDPGWLVDDLVSTVYRFDQTIGAAEPTTEPPPPPPPSGVIVDFEASGWKWLQTTRGDSTDYSPPSFNDSAWASAPAPFGATNPAHDMSAFHGVTWPDYVTTWNQVTRMWARRAISPTAGTDLSISVRWNRTIVAYFNGVSIYTGDSAAGQHTISVPGSSVTGSDLIAIRITDDSFTGSGTGCYFDAKVEQ